MFNVLEKSEGSEKSKHFAEFGALTVDDEFDAVVISALHRFAI